MRSTYQTIEGMCLHFCPDAARGLTATLQFEVSGSEPGIYRLEIDDDRCEFGTGPADSPSLLIRTPSEVWQRIAQGEISGRDALLQGLYEVEGDAGILMRMDSLFPTGSEPQLEAEGRQRPAGPISLSGMQWLAAGLLPWAAFWLLFDHEQLGGWITLTVCLVLSAAVVIYRSAFHEPTSLETGSTALFAGMLALWPLSAGWMRDWGSTVATIALGVIWLATIRPGSKPLTVAYSKWKYVPALWTNSAFLHVNAVLTLLWGWLFVLQGGIDVWISASPELTAQLSFLKFGLPLPAGLFTAWYSKRGPEIRLVRPALPLRRIRLAAAIGLGAAIALVAMTWLGAWEPGGVT